MDIHIDIDINADNEAFCSFPGDEVSRIMQALVPLLAVALDDGAVG